MIDIYLHRIGEDIAFKAFQIKVGGPIPTVGEAFFFEEVWYKVQNKTIHYGENSIIVILTV